MATTKTPPQNTANARTPRIRSSRKHPVTTVTYRAPFTASDDSHFVLDALGYVVAQFQDNERIGTEPAASFIVRKLNQADYNERIHRRAEGDYS